MKLKVGDKVYIKNFYCLLDKDGDEIHNRQEAFLLYGNRVFTVLWKKRKLIEDFWDSYYRYKICIINTTTRKRFYFWDY